MTQPAQPLTWVGFSYIRSNSFLLLLQSRTLYDTCRIPKHVGVQSRSSYIIMMQMTRYRQKLRSRNRTYR